VVVVEQQDLLDLLVLQERQALMEQQDLQDHKETQ
jgi:hypothetical protein